MTWWIGLIVGLVVGACFGVFVGLSLSSTALLDAKRELDRRNWEARSFGAHRVDDREL